MTISITKFLYFPVVVILTILALAWWSQKLIGPALIASIDAIVMWSMPVIAKRKLRIIQFSIRANVVVLVALLALIILSSAP